MDVIECLFSVDVQQGVFKVEKREDFLTLILSMEVTLKWPILPKVWKAKVDKKGIY